jgi:hypothetical protein
MTAQAAGWWGAHGVHVTVVLGPVLVFTVLAAASDARAWLRKRSARQAPRVSHPMLAAAVLSAAAALVHVAVCPEHFHEALLYGVFFGVTAGAQIGWAILAATRTGSWLAPAGLMGNAALVLLWTVTRTVGIPLGPEAGSVESLGALDILATTCEIGVLSLCAIAIGHHVHPWRTPRRSGCATPSSST